MTSMFKCVIIIYVFRIRRDLIYKLNDNTQDYLFIAMSFFKIGTMVNMQYDDNEEDEDIQIINKVINLEFSDQSKFEYVKNHLLKFGYPLKYGSTTITGHIENLVLKNNGDDEKIIFNTTRHESNE